MYQSFAGYFLFMSPDTPIQNTKVHLTEEKATLLITLYAKAMDYRSANPVLEDKKADKIVRRIDYDFNKFKSLDNNNATVIRARHYDEWLKEFLQKHANALVLYLGCGLDTRVSRIARGNSILWYDVDQQEVIDLRRNFYKEEPGYKMIASSVTETGWLNEVPGDRPTMIIAEGLLEYLTEAEVKTLFNRLTSHFSHGEIIFDVMSSFAINSGKEQLKQTTGAVHKWAVDDITQVDNLDPKLKGLSVVSFLQSPYTKKLSFGFRLLFGLMAWVPKFRHMLRFMRYRF